MKTNKDICAELKRVFCIYEIGDEVSDKHVRLFSKYMDKYINAIKHRPGTTTHIDVVNCPQYNKPLFQYYNESEEYATASITRAVTFYLKGTVSHDPVPIIKQAFRYAIVDQIIRFKHDTIEGVLGECFGACEGCHKRVGCGDGGLPKLEADHYPKTFRFLLEEFMSKKRRSLASVRVKRVNEIHSTIVDEVLLREWRAFHDTFARYRALCKSCHLRMGKKK